MVAEENKDNEEKRLKTETTTQREAFELYYSLGESRSLKAVATQFGKSERTVANWSRDFSWVDRCIQRAIEESDSKEKKAVQLDIKTRYRKLFHNLLIQAIKDYNAGELKVRSIADLEKLAKLDLALIDSPIDAVGGEAKLDPEDKQAIDALLNTIKGGLNSLRAE